MKNIFSFLLGLLITATIIMVWLVFFLSGMELLWWIISGDWFHIIQNTGVSDVW